MKAGDIIKVVDSFAPEGIQEPWDNSGLITGSMEAEVKGLLLSVDITEAVMDEAGERGCNMIITHHPMVFSGLKKFSGTDPVSRMVKRAIKEDLVIYSAHTNLDQVPGGISGAAAESLGLKNVRVLVPRRDDLIKLVTFIPDDYFEMVSFAVFQAGAGHIGNYDSCGFSSDGTGSFRAGKGTNPFSGKPGELHKEKEKRFETVFSMHLRHEVLKALEETHPYEEVAYDMYPVVNENPALGFGAVGELPEAMTEPGFLSFVKQVFNTGCIRHTEFTGRDIKRVALLGGSGSEFLSKAMSAGADAYITSDVKYHQFFNADNKILLLDIGHYESEQVAIKILNNLISEKITNFAVHLSKISTNPIKYF